MTKLSAIRPFTFRLLPVPPSLSCFIVAALSSDDDPAIAQKVCQDNTPSYRLPRCLCMVCVCVCVWAGALQAQAASRFFGSSRDDRTAALRGTSRPSARRLASAREKKREGENRRAEAFADMCVFVQAHQHIACVVTLCARLSAHGRRDGA